VLSKGSSQIRVEVEDASSFWKETTNLSDRRQSVEGNLSPERDGRDVVAVLGRVVSTGRGLVDSPLKDGSEYHRKPGKDESLKKEENRGQHLRLRVSALEELTVDIRAVGDMLIP